MKGWYRMNSVIRRECAKVVSNHGYSERFSAFIDSEINAGYQEWIQETSLPDTAETKRAYRSAFIDGGTAALAYAQMLDDELPTLVAEVAGKLSDRDPDTMRIIYLRCVEGVETWQKVAERMGTGWTAAACRVRFHRYIHSPENAAPVDIR